MIEEERIYEFLGRLNSEYDPVPVQIFGKEPLPSLQEVFSYIQNEESRRSTMLHSNSHSQSALVRATQRTPSSNSKFRDRDKTADATSDDKDKLFCDHCNRSRHTQETCWKLHGRPTQGCGVAQVEDLDLEPIILLQLRRPLPHLIRLPLLQI